MAASQAGLEAQPVKGPPSPPSAVLVWARGDRPAAAEAASAAARRLAALGVDVLRANQDLDGPAAQEQWARADLAVVFGGDGTMVAAGRAAAPWGVPVIGVNYGTFGFLTEINADDLEPALERLRAGQYVVEERLMLAAAVPGQAPLLAANDIVLKSLDAGLMLELVVRLDGEPIAEMPADGLIVATPTGSTAYNLSAGGPVVTPGVSAYLLTPICPHTLTTRPLLLSAEAKLTIEVVAARRTSQTAVLAVDGQTCRQLALGASLAVAKAEANFRLARLRHSEFFHSLRCKLGWGLPK